jgi:RES domain-containing protein
MTPVHGSIWVREKRSLVLVVPSSAAHIERNFLINPFHPDFPKITTDLHKPVYWDQRLFE